ncbi:methyl-accepting chemotaxis protein, partial [Pseudomonas aeruginosa]
GPAAPARWPAAAWRGPARRARKTAGKSSETTPRLRQAEGGKPLGSTRETRRQCPPPRLRRCSATRSSTTPARTSSKYASGSTG